MVKSYLEDTMVRLFGEDGTDLVHTEEITIKLMCFKEWLGVSKTNKKNELNALASKRCCYYILIMKSGSNIGIAIPTISDDSLTVYYEVLNDKYSNTKIGFYASLVANLIALEQFGSKIAKNQSIPVKPIQEMV
jgi:hypothetical protein